MKKFNTDMFISKSREVHGDKYDYSLVCYVRAKTEVTIVCPDHGQFMQLPSVHMRGSMCGSCAVVQRRETMMNKYGVSHATQSTIFKEKAKQTNIDRYGGHSSKSPNVQLKAQDTNMKKYGVNWSISSDHSRTKRDITCVTKYGVSNPRKSESVKNKIKQTNMERYGVDNPQQNVSIKDKTSQTNLERYGHISPFGSTIIQQKIKQTLMERYGVDNPQQLFGTKDKTSQTNLERYGHISPFGSTSIQQKIKQTLMERYGVDNPMKSSVIQLKSNKTNIKRYGVNHYAQHHMVDSLPLISDFDYMYNEYIIGRKTATQISKELGIGDTTIGRYLKKLEIDIRKIHHSYVSILWLNYIMERNNIYVQHALNVGEYLIPGTRWKADGYCEETNTIYEFHGDFWHGNPQLFLPETQHPIIKKTMGELYQSTIHRENVIKSLGYNLVVMWESDFN